MIDADTKSLPDDEMERAWLASILRPTSAESIERACQRIAEELRGQLGSVRLRRDGFETRAVRR